MTKRQNIDLNEKHDDFNEEYEQASPEHQRKSAYGGGSGLTEGNAPPIPTFTDFLTQLKAMQDTTATLAATTDDSVMKGCLMSLGSIIQAAGHFLDKIPQRLQTVEEKLSEVPSFISTQIEEQERRRSMVFSFVPESKNESSTERAKEDAKSVTQMLDVMKIEAVPQTVYRLGKIFGGRPRLLKVVMPMSGAVSGVMKNRGKLQNTQFSNVHIRESWRRDWLDKQRELRKRRDELNDGLPAAEMSNRYIVWGPPDNLRLMRKDDVHK